MNAAKRRQWREYIYGCGDLTRAQQIVLLALADYSDWPTGANAHPGAGRLAELCGLTVTAVERALSRGRDLKLIERTQAAKPRRGWADVYRLLPAPVITRTAVRVMDELLPVPPEAITRTAVKTTKPLTPSPSKRHTPALRAQAHSPEPDSPSKTASELPGKAKEARTGRQPVAEDWEPTPEQWGALQAEYGSLYADLTVELGRWITWAINEARTFPSLLHGFKRWLDTGGSGKYTARGSRAGAVMKCRHTGRPLKGDWCSCTGCRADHVQALKFKSTADARIAQTMALAEQYARAEMSAEPLSVKQLFGAQDASVIDAEVVPEDEQ